MSRNPKHLVGPVHYRLAEVEKLLDRLSRSELTDNNQALTEKLKSYRLELVTWLYRFGHVTPSTRIIHPDTGETRRCDVWSKWLEGSYNLVSNRLNQGWNLKEALEKPNDNTRTTVPRLWGEHHDPEARLAMLR
ncbi:MAG: hypothetical protein JJ891_01840 [Rhizobiaceae bacterium]|nr:hypothetical protein [Rhizobiaceae bacterium]